MVNLLCSNNLPMMTTKTNFRKQLNRQQQNKRMDSIGLLLIPILTILLGWGLHVLIGQPFLLTFPFNGIFIASIILMSSIAYFLMRKFSSTTWLDDSFSITTLGLTWILMLLLFTFFPEDISRHHVTNIENIHLSWTAILMAIISIVFFTFKIIHRITEKRWEQLLKTLFFDMGLILAVFYIFFAVNDRHETKLFVHEQYQTFLTGGDQIKLVENPSPKQNPMATINILDSHLHTDTTVSIFVNHPFRYKGWNILLYDIPSKQPWIQLQLVYDPWQLAFYMAAALFFLQIGIIMLIPVFKNRKKQS